MQSYQAYYTKLPLLSHKAQTKSSWEMERIAEQLYQNLVKCYARSKVICCCCTRARIVRCLQWGPCTYYCNECVFLAHHSCLHHHYPKVWKVWHKLSLKQVIFAFRNHLFLGRLICSTGDTNTECLVRPNHTCGSQTSCVITCFHTEGITWF